MPDAGVYVRCVIDACRLACWAALILLELAWLRLAAKGRP
jgi:hypothetical protein